MKENTRKLLLYGLPIRAYWKLSKPETSIVDTKIGIYPSSLAPRVHQGHYDQFDENGIPGKKYNDGNYVHHWTTICSYALANWELYKTTGKKEYSDTVLRIANFLVENVTQRGEVAIFLHYDDYTKTTGQTCAMNQGEAMSVLIRAHELTGDQTYLNLALAACNAYDHQYGDDGVVGNLPSTDIPWFLEIGKYILNGHIYACWGLWELAEYSGSEKARKHFERGCRSVEQALEKFDTGWWSWYWLNEPLYIASIMYHNLHIVQLEHLARISNSDKMMMYSKKFERYAKNPINRFRSGWSLFSSKMKRK